MPVQVSYLTLSEGRLCLLLRIYDIIAMLALNSQTYNVYQTNETRSWSEFTEFAIPSCTLCTSHQVVNEDLFYISKKKEANS